MALLTAACSEEGLVNGLHATRARLAINASIEAAGEQVDVTVSYLRQPATPVRLASKQFPITGTGQQQFSLDVDIGGCLDDPQRVQGSGGNCSLRASVVLRDAAGVLIDSANVGPIDAVAGATANAPSVRLQAAEAIEVLSGDQQLGWPGQGLFYPVVLRVLDRAGAPIARRGITITPPAGGAVVTPAPLVTNDTGVVQVDLRLATTEGQQQFTVRSAGGGTPAQKTVVAHGVPPRRDRIAVGSVYACIAAGPLSTNYCWGNANLHGELGNGLTGAQLLPGPIATTVPFTTITGAKNNNTLNRGVCALSPAGEAYCWGSNEGGYLGVPGTSTCQVAGFPAVPCTLVPQRLPGTRTFAAIAVGGTRPVAPIVQASPVCGIEAGGLLVCWGNNRQGALGDGTTQSRGAPAPVNTPDRFVAVTAGDDFVCALSGKAEAWCWGANGSGQLGDGTTTDRTLPVRAAGGRRFVAISAGSTTTCAIDQAADIWCWGTLLGTGSGSAAPALLGGGRKYRDVSVASLAFACAVTTGGQVACWGSGNQGQLGAGFLNDVSTNPRTVVGLPSGIVQVSSGLSNSCATTPSLDLFCWGSAGLGGLGVAATANMSRPVRVNVLGQAAGTPVALQAATDSTPPVAVGNGASVSVRTVDASGFGVPGTQVAIRTVSGGGSVAQTPVTTNASGFATVTGIAGILAGKNVFEVSLASNPAISVTFSVTGVIPGAPTRLFCSVSCTAQTTVGGTYNFALLPDFTVLDSAGFPVANVSINVVASRPGIVTNPALPATLITPITGRIGLSTWTADTVARIDTLTVSVAGAPGIAAALLVLRAVPAAPQRVVFFSTGAITGVKAGTVVGPIVIHLRDRYQNLATNAAATPVTLSLQSAPPGGTLGGTTTVTAAGGVATFGDITFNLPGTYTMRVSSGTLTASTLVWNIVP